MFPACIVIAATATFSGISGAALMTPFFLIGFPLMGVPGLSTVTAIGAALFLETSGFGTGVFYYTRQGLADLKTARMLLVATLPLAIIGAVLAHYAPITVLRLGYGVAMLAVVWLLFRESGSAGKRRRSRAHVLCANPSAQAKTAPRTNAASFAHGTAMCIAGVRIISGRNASFPESARFLPD
jgi:uncharacterized membrane protein YfcA